MRKPVLLTAGALVLAGLFSSASAATPLPTQQVYFHCPDSGVKLLNTAAVTGETRWNPTAPTASVTTGAGCGFADDGVNSGTSQTSIYDAHVQGGFTGDLDSLTVQFHDIAAGLSRAGDDLSVDVRLTIDGQSMFGTEDSGSDVVPGDVPARATVPVTLVPSSTGASSLAEFTITGLNFIEPEPAAGEPAPEPVEHSLVLTIEGTSDVVSGWVMDTTETPSGIRFNPATPAAARLRATTPGPLPVEEYQQ